MEMSMKKTERRRRPSTDRELVLASDLAINSFPACICFFTYNGYYRFILCYLEVCTADDTCFHWYTARQRACHVHHGLTTAVCGQCQHTPSWACHKETAGCIKRSELCIGRNENSSTERAIDQEERSWTTACRPPSQRGEERGQSSDDDRWSEGRVLEDADSQNVCKQGFVRKRHESFKILTFFIWIKWIS